MATLITNVNIQNFKGIKQCKIEQIKRINFFIGRNDACKSTTLESIYYPLMETINPNLGNIFGRRSNVFWGAKELWYNYVTKNPIQIRLVFDKAILDMKLQLHETSKEDYNVESYVAIEDLTADKKIGQTTANYSKDFTSASKGTFGAGMFAGLSPSVGNMLKNYSEEVEFLDSSDKNDITAIQKLLGKLKNDGKAEEFGKYLNLMFEKGKKWEFIPHPENSDEFVVAFTNGVPKFITGMGDGIRFAMQLIGTGMMVKDTAIFVEEIESNQHFGSLRKLISFLIETAFRNNLQLFVTTHNDSVLQAVYRHFQTADGELDKRAEELNVFHVQREDKTGIVKCEPLDIFNREDHRKIFDDIC